MCTLHVKFKPSQGRCQYYVHFKDEKSRNIFKFTNDKWPGGALNWGLAPRPCLSQHGLVLKDRMSCLLVVLRQGLEVPFSAPEWSDDLPASGDPVTAAMALPYGLGAFLHDGPPLLKVASSRHPLAVGMIFGFSQPSSQGWEKSSCPLPLP